MIPELLLSDCKPGDLVTFGTDGVQPVYEVWDAVSDKGEQYVVRLGRFTMGVNVPSDRICYRYEGKRPRRRNGVGALREARKRGLVA